MFRFDGKTVVSKRFSTTATYPVEDSDFECEVWILPRSSVNFHSIIPNGIFLECDILVKNNRYGLYRRSKEKITCLQEKTIFKVDLSCLKRNNYWQ